MSLFGNVIFHAFHAPYIGVCFAPVLVLLVLMLEAAILWVGNRRSSIGVICGCAVGMNAVSYLVGFLVVPSLFVAGELTIVDPDEHGRGVLARGPNWEEQARLAFLQAWVVSTVVEVLALLAIQRWVGLQRVIVPVIVGNVLSYVMLFVGFVSVFGPSNPTTG